MFCIAFACWNLRVKLKKDWRVIKFQYLYTCVITCLAIVSNIHQPQELFASLCTRSKQFILKHNTQTVGLMANTAHANFYCSRFAQKCFTFCIQLLKALESTVFSISLSLLLFQPVDLDTHTFSLARQIPELHVLHQGWPTFFTGGPKFLPKKFGGPKHKFIKNIHYFL